MLVVGKLHCKSKYEQHFRPTTFQSSLRVYQQAGAVAQLAKHQQQPNITCARWQISAVPALSKR